MASLTQEIIDFLNRMCPAAREANLGSTLEQQESDIEANTEAVADAGDPRKYDAFGDGAFGICAIQNVTIPTVDDGGGGAKLVITAQDVIRAIYTADTDTDIVYKLKKAAGSYGAGNTDPKLEKLSYTCSDIPDGVSQTVIIYLKVEQGSDWQEASIQVLLDDRRDYCDAP